MENTNQDSLVALVRQWLAFKLLELAMWIAPQPESGLISKGIYLAFHQHKIAKGMK